MVQNLVTGGDSDAKSHGKYIMKSNYFIVPVAKLKIPHFVGLFIGKKYTKTDWHVNEVMDTAKGCYDMGYDDALRNIRGLLASIEAAETEEESEKARNAFIDAL